jgi:hypothetical protein
VWSFIGLLFQILPKSIEAPFPRLLSRRHPIAHCIKPLNFQLARPNTADFRRHHDARALEYLKVLNHRCERHGQWRGKLGYARWSVAKPFHDLPARGIRKRVEDRIDVRLVKHALKYVSHGVISQEFS